MVYTLCCVGWTFPFCLFYFWLELTVEIFCRAIHVQSVQLLLEEKDGMCVDVPEIFHRLIQYHIRKVSLFAHTHTHKTAQQKYVQDWICQLIDVWILSSQHFIMTAKNLLFLCESKFCLQHFCGLTFFASSYVYGPTRWTRLCYRGLPRLPGHPWTSQTSLTPSVKRSTSSDSFWNRCATCTVNIS